VRVQPGDREFVLRPGVSVAAAPGAEAVAAGLATLLARATGAAVRFADEGIVTLRLAGDEHPPEGYRLAIDEASVALAASTPAGLFRGIQTLRQLLPPAVDGASTVHPEWRLPACSIVDYPRYSYRGVMLDVARHFFDVADLRRLVDLAALYKLNHLHLHL